MLLLLGLVIAACGPQAPPPPPDATMRLHIDSGLGLSFEIPDTWIARHEGTATVLSAPEGADGNGYYTTLTLQASAHRSAAPALVDFTQLESVLSRSYGDRDDGAGAVLSLSRIVWLARAPTRVADTPALDYFVRFELYERERLRAGVLFPKSGAFVDLSYTAPSETFAENLAVFEHCLASMHLAAGDGGSP